MLLSDSLAIDRPTTISIDRLGNFYIATNKGALKKYSADLKFQLEYAPQKNGKISLAEAWNPLRVLVFYENFQEYLFLDRFLTTSNRFDLRPLTDYAAMVTPSVDNNIWLVDLTDFGLKKYNIQFRQFTIQTPFDLLLDPGNYEISHIREYQNLVFVSDKKSGILVFDNLGNYLRTIKHKGVNYFNFLANEIYFLEQNMLVYYDIYNQNKRLVSLPESGDFVLSNDSKIYLFKEDEVRLYKLSP